MTFDWHNLLAADDDWGGISHLVLVIVLIVLGILGSVLGKIKEKYDKEQAERKRREYEQQQGARQASRPPEGPRAAQPPAQRPASRPGAAQPTLREAPPPPPRREPTPAEQAIAALRAAMTGQQAPPSRPPPAPRRRPQQPPVETIDLTEHVAGPTEQRPERLGEGVRDEVRRAERHLSAEEAERRRRIGQVRHLRTGIEAAEAPRADAATGRRRLVRVDLTGPKEAMSGIIYSEILGPPKALRPGPEPWEQ